MNIPKRLLDKVRQWLWTIAVVLLVMVAVYVTAGRLFFSGVSVYKADLEQQLSQTLGMTLNIETFEGGWIGFDPVVVFKQVRLIPPDVQQDKIYSHIRIGEITVQPDILLSLVSGRVVMTMVKVGDVDIYLQQASGGVNAVDQIRTLASGYAERVRAREAENPAEGLSWKQFSKLIATTIFEFEQINFLWQEDDRTLLSLSIPAVNMKVSKSEIKASGYIQEPVTGKSFGQFSFAGQTSQNNKLDSTFYLAWQNPGLLTPVADWLTKREIFAEPIDSHGEFWLTAQAGVITEAILDIQSVKFDWSSPLACMIPMRKFVGTFAARKDSSSWSVVGYDLDLQWADKFLEINKLLVNPLQNKTRDSGYQILIDSINVDLLGELALASTLLPESASQPLYNLVPEGFLNNIQLNIWPSARDFSFSALLDNVQVSAFKGAPALGNVNGYIYLDPAGGHVEFSGEKLTLNFPQLFFNGWNFNEAEGRVDWYMGEDFITVSGRDLALTHPDGKQGQFTGGFSIDLPSRESTGFLDLALFGTSVDAEVVESVVPGHTVGRKLHEWLELAISKGSVSEAAYLYSGEVGKNARKGYFQSTLLAKVVDVELKFHPDWPSLANIEAELEMQTNRLRGEIHGATVSGTMLEKSTVVVNGLNSGSPTLDIFSRLKPTAEDWHYWLLNSPMAEYVEGALGDWKIEGESEVDLRVLLEFDEMVPRVWSTIYAESLNFSSANFGVEVNDVAGQVRFDSERGIFSDTFRGVLLEQPFVASVDTALWSERDRTVNLQLISQLSLDRLTKFFDVQTNFPVTGSFGYEANLKLVTGLNSSLQYSVTTDLKGVAIDLPPPFQKKAAETRELRFSRDWSAESQLGRWRLDVDDWFDVSLLDDTDELHTGLVRFGNKGKYKLPESGVAFVGSLPELNVQQWQDFISHFQYSTESAAASSDEVNGSGSKNKAGASQKITELADRNVMDKKNNLLLLLKKYFAGVEVDVGRLTIATETFNNVSLSASLNEIEYMAIDLQDEGRIAGKIELPLGKAGKIRLSLQKLHLSESSADYGEPDIVPQNIPPVDVEIKDLRFGKKELGSWYWEANKREDGIVFENLKASLQGATFKGRLSWLYDEKTDVHTSILTGGMKGKKLEKLAGVWTDHPALNSKTFSISMGIVWSAPPAEFSWEQVTGKMSFTMNSGTISDAAGSANVLRIFGILNTEAFTRRLSLDFSDIYQKGLAYDQIEGKARINEGLVHFDSPLAIQAPSSAFKITGTTSLVDDSLDMELVVVLPVSKNLPLASLLVGVPQIGGAVYLIDRLLGEPLSKLTSATYRIRGTIQDPQIELDESVAKPGNRKKKSRRRTEQD